jgi:lipopolysaccharide/colanic/teichoic acid biosynthesis glycosyltransferase
MLLIGILIKLIPRPDDSPPAVMGINGKQFDAYKFRTMYSNGDEILEQYPELQKELGGNHNLRRIRITRGAVTGKTSLDEPANCSTS